MASYPPIWGHRYWLLIHASAYSFRDHVFEASEARMIRMFLEGLGSLLPCWFCRKHCALYMQEHPPDFETGEAYWLYTIDLHNDVNNRTRAAICLTQAEASAHLRARLHMHGVKPSRLMSLDSCLRVFWVPVLQSLLIECDTRVLPDTGEFVHAVCFALPFSRHRFDCNTTAFERMKSVSLDFGSHLSVMQTICSIHNILCTEDTELIPMTVKEITRTVEYMLHHAPIDFVHQAYVRSQHDRRKSAHVREEAVSVRRAFVKWRCAAIVSHILGSVLLILVLVLLLLRHHDRINKQPTVSSMESSPINI